MANENPKALPNLFNSDSAIADLRAAIREIDEHSIVALKDLTKAFNSQKRRLDALEREIKSTETNVSDVETALEQNNNELNSIQTVQNKILTQVGRLETLLSSENRRLERKIDDETGELNKNFKDLSRKIEQSGGISLTNIGGMGAAAARAAPAAEAAVSKRTLATMVPALAKNAVRGIGGIIAAFTTDIVSGIAEATGHPQIAAGADILGDTIAGASLGGLFGPLGATVGGIIGAGYGAYQEGGQLLGSSEISPQIKELQQQAEERTAAQQRERIAIEQLHEQKPELSNFSSGGVPEVVAPPQGPAAPSNYTPSNAFFDAIIKAEGTSKKGDPYNTSLGYMNSPKPLTQMTLDESLAWGDQIRAAQGLNSSAKGAFQIVNTTQRAAMKALGLKGTDLFNEENQRKMAAWVVKSQGLGAWEGFKLHPDQRQIAQQAMASGLHQQTSMPITQPTTANITPSTTTPTSTTTPQVGRSGANPQMVNGATPMSQTPSTGGPPGNDIIGLGKWLQSQGIRVSEHPSFGGVHPEQHGPNSAHNDGMAIDINAPGGITEANDPVWGKKFDELAQQIKAAGYTVLWRARNHENHIHAQIGGKGIRGGQSVIGGQAMGEPIPNAQQSQLPPQATQPTPEAPQVTAPPMGAAIGSSGIAGMEAQLMGNPMMMMGGLGGSGGMAGMVASMVAPMLLNSLSQNVLAGQLQNTNPQTAELISPSIGSAPIAPVDDMDAEFGEQPVNNINVMGAPEKGASTATPQNQVMMNARPDWLGGLAEGLLGATYTGMSRPKYFGAGTGKM